MTARQVETIETYVLPGELPLSSACKVGDLVYVSGNLGNRHGTLELVEGGTGPETGQALQNMKTILEAAGSAVDRVVKVNAYIVDMADFADFNEEYRAFFGSHKPARATVAVKQLGLDARVEIECVALA
jgi:reactive intermediate/imine deaminase